MDKVILNPISGEKVTFLKESSDTDGEYSKVLVELEPFAKGVPKHYHINFTEEFEVLEGEMMVRVGKEKKTLKSGEKALIPINMIHAFRNYTDQHVKFTVTLRPGSVGFERSIRTLFGLARDGKCKKNGLPKSFVHLALLAKWGEGMVPWPMSILVKLLNKKADRAEVNGKSQELIDKYCS